MALDWHPSSVHPSQKSLPCYSHCSSRAKYAQSWRFLLPELSVMPGEHLTFWSPVCSDESPTLLFISSGAVLPGLQGRGLQRGCCIEWQTFPFGFSCRPNGSGCLCRRKLKSLFEIRDSRQFHWSAKLFYCSTGGDKASLKCLEWNPSVETSADCIMNQFGKVVKAPG